MGWFLTLLLRCARLLDAPSCSAEPMPMDPVGGVATAPWKLPAVEQALIGESP
ncbi:hypothetical protein [Streptomyces sp. NPDC005476]|uniref:hypothetical protein n=1 Tax=Streptomyces sp. NPDC005476 TaxID=3156882 RepID=UPI003456B7E2